MSNVSPGDLARIVNTGTSNDGGLVRVIRPADSRMSIILALHEVPPPYWDVEVLSMVIGWSITTNRPETRTPGKIGTMPDSKLRRIPPDEMHDDTERTTERSDELVSH